MWVNLRPRVVGPATAGKNSSAVRLQPEGSSNDLLRGRMVWVWQDTGLARMTKILVVDDSAVDRRLAAGLLEGLDGIDVQTAEHGEQAIEVMGCEAPDLVLIDLMMPGMSGLELVESIRANFPQVATVLMTSRGNEDLAIQALLKGAASYVPKREMATELATTVKSVIQSTKHVRSHHRLMSCLTETTSKFLLDNDCQLIAPLVGHVQDVLNHVRFGDETDRMQVGVALDEALANAIYHGNLEISSDVRERDGREFHRIAEQRRTEIPYSRRRVRVEAAISTERAHFLIADEGPGFDPTTLPDPRDAANLENVTGRGILLMRTFMDDVSYSPTGTSVSMTKQQ